MTKHTPGPWEACKSMVPVIDTENLVWNGDYVIWEGDKPIAEVNCCDGIGEVQAGYNARLIAAAPELLEAICYLRGVCQGQTHAQFEEALEMADSAISKAKGETE